MNAIELLGVADDDGACTFCGELAELELLEVWPDTREFQLDTCCEELHAHAVDEMAGWDRKTWQAFMLDGALLDVRQVICEPQTRGSWTLDYGLRIGPVEQATAKAFVREHHRHNAPPAGWRYGLGCYNGGELIAVAMIGRPVARALDPATVVEVNRLCVDPDAEPGLIWNACSMLYGAAAREAKARGFRRIITYTLESERGTTLRAAGWTQAATTKGGSWDTPSRRRRTSAPTCPKIRWERELIA